MRLPMSPAASGLLRELVRRGACDRDRILLIDVTSVEWQSLTFVGERHRLEVRVTGPDAPEIVRRIADGLEDADLAVSGHIVADIRWDCEWVSASDGSVSFAVEALTVEE